MQTKFYQDILWSQCEDGLVVSFIEIHNFTPFLRNFALNNM